MLNAADINALHDPDVLDPDAQRELRRLRGAAYDIANATVEPSTLTLTGQAGGSSSSSSSSMTSNIQGEAMPMYEE